MAMAHGLNRGRHSGAAAGAAGSIAVLIRPCIGTALAHAHFRRYGHAGTQKMVRILSRIQSNSHGNSLHYFDVVSGGIFWRQQTEFSAASSGDALNGPVVIAAVGVH